MPSYTVGDDFQTYGPISCGAKLWISATAVADYGDAQALIPPAPWPSAVTRYRAIEIGGGALTNRSGTTLKAVGLGVRFGVQYWGAGTVTAAGVYVDDTTDAQDAGTNDFPMHTAADSGSGFLIHARAKFNCIDIIQGVAGDQTTPIMIYEYWDGAAWTALTLTLYDTTVTLNTGTGEKLILYPTPHNWVKGGTGTNVPQHHYCLRIRQTHSGAGSVAPSASQIFIGQAHVLTVELPDDFPISLVRQDVGLRFTREGEALFPVVTAASALNTIQIDGRYYVGNGG